jgi:hypothetical protein
LGVLCRFLRFLADQRPVPAGPAGLRAAHLDRFRAHRAATVAPAGTLWEMRQLLALLGQEPLCGSLAAEVADYLGRRWKDPRQPGRPGYSDGELAKILAAARSDAVAACRRIEAAERLLHRYRQDPAALSEAESAAGAELAAMEATGLVPGGRSRVARGQLARQLFLTREDLAPLLVLMVALTGRNGEAVKDSRRRTGCWTARRPRWRSSSAAGVRAAGLGRRSGRPGRRAGACTLRAGAICWCTS